MVHRKTSGPGGIVFDSVVDGADAFRLLPLLCSRKRLIAICKCFDSKGM